MNDPHCVSALSRDPRCTRLRVMKMTWIKNLRSVVAVTALCAIAAMARAAEPTALALITEG